MLTDEAIPQARNYALDFYRFLFSCVICIMHFTAYMDFGDAHAPFCGGYLAVEFFFIVSGYMLMRHVEREKKKPVLYRPGAVPPDMPENALNGYFPIMRCR